MLIHRSSISLSRWNLSLALSRSALSCTVRSPLSHSVDPSASSLVRGPSCQLEELEHVCEFEMYVYLYIRSFNFEYGWLILSMHTYASCNAVTLGRRSLRLAPNRTPGHMLSNNIYIAVQWFSTGGKSQMILKFLRSCMLLLKPYTLLIYVYVYMYVLFVHPQFTGVRSRLPLKVCTECELLVLDQWFLCLPQSSRRGWWATRSLSRTLPTSLRSSSSHILSLVTMECLQWRCVCVCVCVGGGRAMGLCRQLHRP